MRAKTWLLILSLCSIVASIKGIGLLTRQRDAVAISLTGARGTQQAISERTTRAQSALAHLPAHPAATPEVAILHARATILDAAARTFVQTSFDATGKSGLSLNDLSAAFHPTSAGLLLANLPIKGTYTDLAMLMQFVNTLINAGLGITAMTLTGNSFTADVVVAAAYATGDKTHHG